MNRDDKTGEEPVFRYHGTTIILDRDTLSAGSALWEGLAGETGEEEAMRTLEARIDAAGRVFGVPPGPVPDIDQLARTHPAGEVLLTAMAALVMNGIRDYPDEREPRAPDSKARRRNPTT